ncbi:hypothetical protein CDD80_6264 [Ophiocordyceps camponoti-rufipedis]|uniref:Uncharacterized protein n=1 Tax=Ophiocordyceps camponoti-rufipedis TaxID=2004952 RepID=A0A2C5YRX4_9HYPO|nr:hypothetical protein CDD80_6264 [Ophiocordyceps camponoti-rufipedis]
MPPVDQRVDGIPDDRELPYRLALCPALPTVSQSVSLPGHDDNHDNHDSHDDDNHDDTMLTDADSAAASAPALPQKSASRLLASLSQKPAPEDRPILPHAAPHQMYLSSEEDASSSADDMSDLDELDWDAADSRKSSSSSCSSREDTARVVTVVFHGRPSLVELVPRKSTGSTDGPRPTPVMLRTATEPTLIRTRSNSSESSALKHPPRSSSMTPTGFQLRRPQFLTIDPFASHDSESMTSRTPKTPSRMLKKTLSLVKKRSRPLLGTPPPATLSTPPSEQPMTLTTTLTPPSPPLEQLGEEPEDHLPPRAASAADHRESVTYQGIMKNAMRNAQAAARTEAASPPPQHRSRFRAGLSINRPRSVRA